MPETAQTLPQGSPSTRTPTKSTPEKLTEWRLSDPGGGGRVRARHRRGASRPPESLQEKTVDSGRANT